MDYTKEYGRPEEWSDEEKEKIIRQFRKVPAMAGMKDEQILGIAAEHWKVQNGEEIEGAVTLDELEETLRQNRKPRQPKRSPKPGL